MIQFILLWAVLGPILLLLYLNSNVRYNNDKIEYTILFLSGPLSWILSLFVVVIVYISENQDRFFLWIKDRFDSK